MAVMLSITIVQFGVAIACLSVTAQQQHRFLSRMWQAADIETREDAQYQMNCCGFDNQTVVDTGYSGPKCQQAFCCQGSSHPCCTGSRMDPSPHRISPPCPCDICYTKLFSKTNKAFQLTGEFGLSFSFIQLLGFFASCRFRASLVSNEEEGEEVEKQPIPCQTFSSNAKYST